jgi:rhodanese-related sulfurtransferase
MIVILTANSFKFSGFKRQLFNISSKTLSMMSTSSVRNLSPIEFRDIIKSNKSKYQIIDVREANELAIAKYPTEVIHLPLSQSSEWSAKINKGELLKKDMSTICLCKAGGRSTTFANMLGQYL